jgi:TonB family protein
LSINSSKSEASNYDIAKAEASQKTDSSFIYKPSATNTNTWAVKDGIAAERTDDKESKQMMEEKAVAQAPGYNSNAPSGSNNNIQANEGFIDNYNFRKKENANLQAANNTGTFNGNYFYAEVVTPDNKPVGLANVRIPQTNKPIYTDSNGKFKFAAADSSVKVTVTSAGYNTQSFTLSNGYQQNRIVLQPLDIATQKIGAAGKRKAAVKKIEILSDTTSEDDEDDASPSGGWVQYNNYLNNNLVMPNEAKTNNIHGEVELTIQLKNNGEVSQVKVAKPLCSQCDAEALRLVKEGPKFEVKNKKAKEVKVKVKF